jgi:hypothetical protein
MAHGSQYHIYSSFSSSNPAVVPFEASSPAEILRALGLGTRVNYFHTHTPSLRRRTDSTTWSSMSVAGAKQMVKIVVESTKMLCRLFCADNVEAGDALWKLCVSNLPQQTRDQHGIKILQNVTKCYTIAKKGSTEKRVLRARELASMPKLSHVMMAAPAFVSMCLGSAINTITISVLNDENCTRGIVRSTSLPCWSPCALVKSGMQTSAR